MSKDLGATDVLAHISLWLPVTPSALSSRQAQWLYTQLTPMIADYPWILWPCDHFRSFPTLSGSPEKQKKLWLEQLLQLIQKRNSLVTEEAELMIR